MENNIQLKEVIAIDVVNDNDSVNEVQSHRETQFYQCIRGLFVITFNNSISYILLA